MTQRKNIAGNKNPTSGNDISDIKLIVDKKLDFYSELCQKIAIYVQKNKMLEILGISDINVCMDRLKEISQKINDVQDVIKAIKNTEPIMSQLQAINNDFSALFKLFGTNNLDDLILICFGSNCKLAMNEMEAMKLDVLRKYFHPINYKIVNKKEDTIKLSKNEKEIIDDGMNNLDCFDVSSYFKQFHIKVHGIKVYIKNNVTNKSIMVTGILDDLNIDLLKNKFIKHQQNEIMSNLPDDNDFKTSAFDIFYRSLMLKDYLIQKSGSDMYAKFMGYINQNNFLRQKQISQLVKEFITDDLYTKRMTIMQLLIKNDSYDCQYIAYLLYDLLSNDTNNASDTQEQSILFDSFPWTIKEHFKHAMKKTIEYTNELSNFDMNKIPLEQQICLLKAPDSVKEKAMIKLKEVKAKSEDSGSKARQYLDGILKMPFSIYKREPILYSMETIRNKFKDMCKKHNLTGIHVKERYSSIEIVNYLYKLKSTLQSNEIQIDHDIFNEIETFFSTQCKNKEMHAYIENINGLLMKHNYANMVIKKSECSNKSSMSSRFNELIEFCKSDINQEFTKEFVNLFADKMDKMNVVAISKNAVLEDDINEIDKLLHDIKEYMKNVKNTLDGAVHGHDKAKKQIERIIAQWINGELSGYCFGFEGAPGLGKTSLAKRGLSNCLKDENGVSRPFAMIQMGGDSNGSTLHGHNYTYVGSTWGSIVQILIDKKCMNPIIFIDEVDKISRTEHGKEIVGILTHLLDPAQNDCFQDKYFNGIDLDLSKALFILSYNDPDAIDKILLDRVHRIKFSNLSLEDKLIICNTHILPEVYKKMGLEDIIQFDNDVLKFIIEEYTSESGVRKLKEILFEIVGEINLDVLKNNCEYDIPIKLSINDIKNKYFKDRHEIKHKKIHNQSKVGIINGLWANSLGKGGVIPIQVNWRPSDKFLSLNLTGMQGDVMKESMNVALTLAWNLTSNDIKKKIRLEHSNDFNMNGIHIHCPEGAVPKDGPSAGTAITTAIYSLLNERKIKYNIAITGEICFDGNVTEIGGLDLKIMGAIKAGVKEILFPVENMKDYNAFMDKYKDTPVIEDIKFHPVNHISEVLDLVFE